MLVDQYSGIHLRGKDPNLGLDVHLPHNSMGSLVRDMEVPKDPKMVKVPTRQPTMPIPMRKAMVMVTMMNTKRNTMKRMHHT